MTDNELTVVVHSAGFHTDDVFAAATLSLVLEKEGKKFSITRSRDPEVIQAADMVADVGGVYDEKNNRFDHHQEGGAGKRENGIPYAAFGLVWKKFGAELSGDAQIAEKIDKILVQPIDANDNGIQFLQSTKEGLLPYDVGHLTFLFRPTWKESVSLNDSFMQLVTYAQEIIRRQIKVTQDELEGQKIVREAYIATQDKRIIMTESKLPWEEVLSKFPEPLFVIYQQPMDGNWTIKSIRNDMFSYDPRKRLPVSWAGKTGKDLEEVSGVEGALFCHNARFMAVARTKEGVLQMAQKALES